MKHNIIGDGVCVTRSLPSWERELKRQRYFLKMIGTASLPVWERELKPSLLKCFTAAVSLPVRERELKHLCGVPFGTPRRSLPTWERELKPGGATPILMQPGRSLRGSVC